ncbi:YfiR family protein [Geothrix sp. PMB-07]|uniref:YfiR family protein n=1 Tax=Geothrix sp. PMB-07 TaxID=3068640 RepID=UPI0027411A9F|nr:YfiR family protein [Geothrix sp. PMB-07]WLT31223.1 YfiR family protein [Geothrix sp. PMB-07]
MSGFFPTFCLMAFLASDPVTTPPTEYETKARILLMVLPYIQWSSESSWKDGPFVIAVLGDSPFGYHLDEGARSLTIHHRPIKIRYITRVREAEGCHALFVCSSEARRLDGIFAWTRGREVLTLSDDPALAKRGIMLNLLLEEGFVRLAANPEAVQGSGLTLGSRLMALARPIRASGASS